jgi:glucosylceramidase
MKNIKILVLNLITFLSLLSIAFAGCSKQKTTGGGGGNNNNNGGGTTVPVKTDVQMWLTNPDRSQLLAKQNISLLFNTGTNNNTTISVDTTSVFQTIDGFGFALTGGSAHMLDSLNATVGGALLKELFSTDSTSIGVSYIRISLGASDMSAAPFSYDDISSGTDVNLTQFSLAKEQVDLIPVLKKILAINPNIKILACPWSAPAWMKSNNNFYGGSLLPQYYSVYANYFVKYIQAMSAAGINIDAITPQNEPLNAYNNPAMLEVDTAETAFIGNYLGPAFKAANITTKIICYDHNCDHPEYPMYVLNDATAGQYVDGSAFHLYAGDISALSTVHNSYPNKNIYFTEQATFSTGSFSGDLSWHVNNLIVGAIRNWSRNVIEWNLATNPNFGPHTSGGCSTCQGAVTISSPTTFSRNVSYYIIAQASKFVRPGAVRIGSDALTTLPNVAFKNTNGSKVLIVLNNTSTTTSFNIKFNGKIVSTALQGGAVATFVW